MASGYWCAGIEPIRSNGAINDRQTGEALIFAEVINNEAAVLFLRGTWIKCQCVLIRCQFGLFGDLSGLPRKAHPVLAQFDIQTIRQWLQHPRR